MKPDNKFVVSHAPFWQDGTGLAEKHYNIMIAALPACIFGIIMFGAPALGVLAFSVGTAMLWELIFTKLTGKPVSLGNGQAAMTGLLLGMMLPATTPWWLVLVGTLLAVIIGLQIYGGLGGNPFNPVVLAMAVLMLSWKTIMDFNGALVNYDFGFDPFYPLAALKAFGPDKVADFTASGLLMGQQTGGIGTVFGLGLIIGGVYLILRGMIRWEISVSFLVGVAVTAWLFQAFGEADKYASPVIHLLCGYTLFGAFFLATEDSSSPVNFVPMIIFGALAGVMTVLIRTIGAGVDGTVLAILLLNVVNPLIDLIRPKELGKVMNNA